MDHVQQQLDELTDHCKKTEKHLAEVSARAHRLYNVHVHYIHIHVLVNVLVYSNE